MDEEIPRVKSGESVTDYFGRTRDYWLQEADQEAEASGAEVTGKQLKKEALKLAEIFYKQS